MDRQLWILFSGLFLFLFACQNEQAERRIVDQAEAILPINPDSARIVLQSIPLPETLSDQLLTRWCFVYGRVADTLGTDALSFAISPCGILLQETRYTFAAGADGTLLGPFVQGR